MAGIWTGVRYHESMTIRHLDHLNLSVRALDESIDWYGRVFGFELVERASCHGVAYAVIRAGDAMLCMYEHRERRSPERDDSQHAINHFSLRITDPVAWQATIQRESLAIDLGPYRYPHSTSWYLRDPTGYEIEVVAWNNDTVSFESAPLAKREAPTTRPPETSA